MSVTLAANSYGTSRVRVLRVVRGNERHDFFDLTLDIQCTGDFVAAHLEGDNSGVLPTDSMQNAVYALARQAPAGTVEAIELFGMRLGDHLLGGNPQISAVRVDISERLWSRIIVDGQPHRHAFVQGEPGVRTCRVLTAPGTRHVAAGVEGLLVLKTTDSGFSGFARDAYTTLPETDDRILSAAMDLTWRYGQPVDYDATWDLARRTALQTFADHHSLSVQQTGYAIGEAMLVACPAIDEVSLSLPNRHNLLVDLTPLGLDNPNEIFAPVDEPHDQINIVVERGRST